MEQVSVKKLMSASYLTALPGDRVMDVARGMKENRKSCTVIVEKQKPIGIVTERDMLHFLCHAFASQQLDNIQVMDIMSGSPIVLDENASLFDALVLTQARQIRHLPVVDESGCIKGILTYTDLAHAHLHIIEVQREMIERAVERETDHLKRMNQALLQANKQLKELSMEDALMGIGNRRAMEVDLSYTHNAALRYKHPYSVVLFDVDNFKQYNDHYGHGEGDRVLRKISDFLFASIRNADRLYRYGGEEILLILPETTIAGALVLANRLVEGLAAERIEHELSPFKFLTMSGGIGCLSQETPMQKWQMVVNQADNNLYIAKRNGRNQIGFPQSGQISDVSTDRPRQSLGRT